MSDLDEEFETRVARDGGRAAVRWYRSQALRSIGPGLAHRLARRHRRVPWPSEVRWALRNLRARRMTAWLQVGIVGLSVGLGAAVFAAADAFLLRTADYPHVDRLVIFQRSSPVGLIEALDASELEQARISRLFSALYRHVQGDLLYVETGGTMEAVSGQAVEIGLLDALGVQPRWGRPLRASDDQAVGERVVLLSERLARRLFGSPELALDQILDDGRTRVRVVGVMPPGFRFPTSVVDLWQPISHGLPIPGGAVVAVLAPGVTVDDVRRAVDAGALAADAGGTRRPASVGPIQVAAMARARRDPAASTNYGGYAPGDTSALFVVLLGGVAGLMLVTAVNVAGLEFVTSLGRERVGAIQIALGATRGTLVRTALIEVGVLTAAGTVLGLVIAVWGASMLSGALPQALAMMLTNEVDVDRRTLLFILTISLVAFAVGAAVVVWRASRSHDSVLRGEAVTSGGSRPQAMTRHVVTTAQAAVCVLLVLVAALFAQTWRAHATADRGFDATHLLTVELSRLPGVARERDASTALDLLAALRSHPAVAGAARGTLPPFSRAVRPDEIWIGDRDHVAGTARLSTFSIDDSYAQTIDLRLLAGRWPGAADPSHERVIDEALAARFWPEGNAMGAVFGTGSSAYEVVGIASHLVLESRRDADRFAAWAALRDEVSVTLSWIVRLRDPAARDAVVSAIRAATAGYRVRVSTMDDRYAELYAGTRIAAGITVAFGLVALVLLIAGIYGVTTILVARRTRELGIRIALGARRADIQHLVAAPAVLSVAAGAAIGLGVAWAVSSGIESQMHGVSPTDPTTFVAVPGAVLLTTLLATWRPARAASRVDPSVTLRAE